MGTKVTVLMTAYNRENLIKGAIESFLKQEYPDKELLICDDCSTDDTLSVIQGYDEKYPEIRVFSNTENKGFIKTINWLFSIAEGDFICICDSDDQMADNRLIHQVSLLKKYEVDAVVSEFAKINNDGSLEFHTPRYKYPTIIEPNSKDVFFPSGSLMIRRTIIEKVHGYHKYFADAFCADIYFINSIASNFKTIYDPAHMYYYRLTEGSMTQTFNLYRLSKLELSRKLIKSRAETGTDLLAEGKYEELEVERQKIENNSKWKAAQYRLYAARAIDENNLRTASDLLGMAFKKNPFSLSSFRTLIYFIKQRFFGSFKKN